MDKSRLKKLAGYVLLPLALFVLGYSGAVQSIAKAGTLFFKYYTDAELRKLEASGFINNQGAAEYVIGLDADRLTSPGQEFLETREGVTAVRETTFDNWYVVTVEGNQKENIKRIRDQSETLFVLQNRGIWICH